MLLCMDRCEARDRQQWVELIRSLYVSLPAAMDDVGLRAQAAELRELPLSTACADLLHAAEVADGAALEAGLVAANHRAASVLEQRMAMLAGDAAAELAWSHIVLANAAEAACAAAHCAATAARFAARRATPAAAARVGERGGQNTCA